MSFHRVRKSRSGRQGILPGGHAIFSAVLLAICLGMPGAARGQVVPAADRGGLMLSAGGAFSGDYLQYGERKMLGVTGFVDVDTRRDFGIEGEASFKVFRQTANVHDMIYSIGPRYHMNVGGKLQPYAKAMVGLGEFNFPYNYAHGSYMVIAPGAGVDFRLTRRIHFRVADFEYQFWPQFTYGSMTSCSVSSGFSVRIF